MKSWKDIEISPQSKILDPHYSGPIFIWDIDKTYLATQFETLKGLIKTAFEKAHEKENIGGAATLLKELSQGPTSQGQKNPIFFISASPKQMRKVIEQKMKLDGIYFDGIIFKDHFKHIYTGKFKKVKEQVGFKLKELLRLKLLFPAHSQQYLFGDDYEKDALIYSLYDKICRHAVGHHSLQKILKNSGVLKGDIKDILILKERIPLSNPVRHIYIHLEKKTDPKNILKYNSKIVPTFNSFQAALHLFQNKLISSHGVLRVAHDLIQNFSLSPQELSYWLEDALKRDVINYKLSFTIIQTLKKNKCIDSSFKITKWKWWWKRLKIKLQHP
ncbi:MAG: hypothetical protein HYW47_03325 [Deltaproteobacteria bacterium]|nr:hypothetical protein [Deltaproteobacteria bacterium]